ncbi:hypothetical protein N7539_007565 [Penicillium diatomitis]|uniref:Uncharacterized protein n=1 Tax=Penicillium diatomitis TaxID=2819901 RepID=A0A9W9WW89_9EURO|nr:uncharacterized protein N7539_007565 [Penicillium diatomitis]KAJ5477421.1 hypothetical protein N7539_007565 [Penicillium diatomitis]
MGAIVTNLVALPILGLIAIPMVLSAWVTLWVALATLFVRFSVVYLDVIYGFVVSFFTLPLSSSSFLSFAASEPVTPAAGNSRRNSAHGLMQSRWSHDDHLAPGVGAIQTNDESTKHDVKSYAQSMIEAHHLPSSSEPYIGLPVSGDERRDFEGVGGWRSYQYPSDQASRPRTAPSAQEKSFHSASNSSTQSLQGEHALEPEGFDADDLAWLSLNYRLELPSHLVRLGDHLRSAPGVNSPPNLDYYPHASGLGLHAMHPAQSASSRRSHSHSGARHHHRSHTTSALTTSERRTGDFLSLALSTRPESVNRFLSPSASRAGPFMTPQPFSASLSSARTPFTHDLSRSEAYLSRSADAASSFLPTSHGAGERQGPYGYFALQKIDRRDHQLPPSSVISSSSGSGATTPGLNPSGEDRDSSSLGLTRLMAHYPTGVRHRRRSIAGPHSRVVTNGA